MRKRIVVINPNSSLDVTEGIDRAMVPLRSADGPLIDCVTLLEGPPGIESQRHVDQVVSPLCELIEREDNSADAFVIACFSDPGLHSAREATTKPVMGISESSIVTALTLGERFGIIAILPASISRHVRYIRQMGLEGRLAGDRAIGIGITSLNKSEVGDEVERRMTATGRQLIENDGADVLIMGCAGMAGYRHHLERELGVTVIDPSQAAVSHSIAAIQLSYRNNITNN